VVTADAGYDLVERLTAQPPYVLAGAAWIDPRVGGHVAALADPQTGLARDVTPVGRPWQEPDEAISSGRVDLNTAIDTVGRNTDTCSPRTPNSGHCGCRCSSTPRSTRWDATPTPAVT